MSSKGRKICFSVAVAVSICFLGLAALATPAEAQQQACVNLLVGGGYAAKMTIIVGDGAYQREWSSTFPIGQSMCQDLKGTGLTAGQRYSVKVWAMLGKEKVCTPSDLKYDPDVTNKTVYNAWGTTLDIKCEMPN